MKGDRGIKQIMDEVRLEEIYSISPIVDDDAPEITPEQAARARLAHISHPEWYQSSDSHET